MDLDYKNMPCYTPLVGVDCGVRAETGNRYIKVVKGSSLSDWARSQPNVIPLPCGNCIGCRLERSKQWAIRCVHEASLYEDNMFITLTFNDSYVSKQRSLDKEDFQKFMKRVRKWRDENLWNLKEERYERRWRPLSTFGMHEITRYFHCGEYGEKFSRPHHHACVFNLDFKDKVLWDTRGGVRLYRSKTLEKLWPYGYSTIGDVTYDSAAYVARYITKKINGPKAEEHYDGRQPEYTTMSRRPGIGKGWYDRYGKDVYSKDEVAIKRNGKVIIVKPPRYYDKLVERSDPGRYEEVKKERREKAKENPNNKEERLKCRNEITIRRYKRMKRRFEDEA